MAFIRFMLFGLGLVLVLIFWLFEFILISPLLLCSYKRWYAALITISNQFIAYNRFVLNHVGMKLSVELAFDESQFSLKKSGLVISNHQSWVDTFIINAFFYKKLPQPRYFAKRSLLWMPIINIGFLSSNFLMLRRFTKKQLDANPRLRELDVISIRKATRRLSTLPFSIVHFSEGTRNKKGKHKDQTSDFKHLLNPKVGGLGIFLQEYNGPIDYVYDVSIGYVSGPVSFIKFLSGQVGEVKVHIREIGLPESLRHTQYTTSPEARKAFSDWMHQHWIEKDIIMSKLLDKQA